MSGDSFARVDRKAPHLVFADMIRSGTTDVSVVFGCIRSFIALSMPLF